jgi:tetratricopeptide (TPR) repeat protein
MKLKKSVTLFALMVSAVPALAQYEGTSVYERIGTGKDSIECLENLSLFQDACKTQNWTEAYGPWKIIMQKAPCAQLGLYTRGATMLEQLIAKATDVEKKKQYFNDLMGVYDQRIKFMKELNSFATAQTQFNKGTVICRKAYDYANYAPTLDPSYTLDKTYNMFTEGINLVNEDASKDVEGFVLYKYFDTSYKKYQANPTGFHEQFLKDYLLCKEVCEKMLAKANDETDSVAAQKIVSQYDPTLLQVENSFAESHAADRDQLIAIFSPKIEANKTNLAYLKSVIDILAQNNCDNTDVYFKASKYAFAIEPSYESAIGTAQYYTKMGNHAESINYYDKALSLCPTDLLKSKIAMQIVYALGKSGNGAKAEGYLQKAETFNPKMKGRCDMFRAQRAAMARNYDQALTYATRAAAEDASISGMANRLASNIADVKRKNAEVEKQNAAYKAAVAKRQKMDDFWNCK